RRSAFLLLLLLLTWALLALWLARQASPSLFAVLASLLIAFDLFTVNWQNNSVPGRPQDLLAPTATANFLRQQDGDLFRIASEGLLPGDGNAGSLFRLQDMVGNSPLTLRAFQKFEEQVEEWQRWRLLNVRFVITKRRLNDGRFRPVLQEGTINTYELEPALRTPRAYIAYQALTAASEAEALTLTKTVDVPRQVVLQGLLPLPLSGNPQPSTARIIEYQPNHVIIEANTNENGILVLSDTLTPGWRAWVDDQEMQIIPTNYLLRGVPVSQGSHRVELAYEPPGLRLGLWVSLLTLLGCALYLIWRWRRT
ncbi:MAG: YfhO family protein, partial [Chloroflexi bacterium]|nr:YfhO family protein [Chloroflexota bacterium]